MDCIFCRMVSGELPVRKVYENDDVLAFWDLNPQAPIHILIIPKKHIETLSNSSKEDINLLGSLQFAAKEIAKTLNIEDGFRLVCNNGRKSGQEVYHLHYHLLAGRRFLWPPG